MKKEEEKRREEVESNRRALSYIHIEMDSSADLIFMSKGNMQVLAVVSLVGVLLSILKVLFGSYSLPHILREYSTRKQIENTYAQMHRSREAFLYHIGGEREVSR